MEPTISELLPTAEHADARATDTNCAAERAGLLCRRCPELEKNLAKAHAIYCENSDETY